jgi:phage FluMu protein Com
MNLEMASICPICLETDNISKYDLPCKHSFHIHCIAKYIISNHWNSEDNVYKKNQNTFIQLKCPYCRQVIKFNSIDEAKLPTEKCTRVQRIQLRDYFNKRMLNNINLYSEQNIKNNNKKFIFDAFNNNCITLRCIRGMFTGREWLNPITVFDLL